MILNNNSYLFSLQWFEQRMHPRCRLRLYLGPSLHHLTLLAPLSNKQRGLCLLQTGLLTFLTTD